MHKRLALAAILAFFAFGSVALAQIGRGLGEATDLRLNGNNFIAGTVFLPTGRPADRRIGIRLVSPAHGEFVGTTDTYGQFIYGGVPAGLFLIQIDREDEFEPANQSVQITRDREEPSQVYNLSIRLREKTPTPAKTKSPPVVNVAELGVPKNALNLYAGAVKLSEAGEHHAAVEQLKLAVAEYPAFANAFNEMGVQYLRLNNLEKADEALLAALKIEPDAFEPLLNRGIVLFRMNRFADAEPVLRSVLKMKDQSAFAHFYLGRTLAKMQRYDDAEKELLASFAIDGNGMKEAHRILAMMFIDKDDRQSAATALETYLRLVPAAPDAEKLKQAILQLKAAGNPPLGPR